MASLFEIIELSNGEVALRRIDEPDGEPLLRIRFSDDAKLSLNDHHLEVASVMVEAALRRVGELSGSEPYEKDDAPEPIPYQIH
ncbi:MAG: hypothetical protein CMI09_16650 [Oceanospirillaceae bacterium]|nr:hypothetical protein [Oceanospirillaceae bacterium]